MNQRKLTIELRWRHPISSYLLGQDPTPVEVVTFAYGSADHDHHPTLTDDFLIKNKKEKRKREEEKRNRDVGRKS
jgi:hypothetical protein